MDTTTALAAPDPDEPDRPDAPYPPGPSNPTEAALEDRLRGFARKRDRILAEERRSELEPVVAALLGMTTELGRIADSLERTELGPVERVAEPVRLRLDVGGDFREQMRRWARTDPTGFGNAVCRMARVAGPRPADVLPDDTAAGITTSVRQRKAAEERAHRAEAAVARVRALAEDMRTWCSPHGIATEYATRLLAVLDEPPACTCTHADRCATCRATDTPKDQT